MLAKLRDRCPHDKREGLILWTRKAIRLLPNSYCSETRAKSIRWRFHKSSAVDHTILRKFSRGAPKHRPTNHQEGHIYPSLTPLPQLRLGPPHDSC